MMKRARVVGAALMGAALLTASGVSLAQRMSPADKAIEYRQSGFKLLKNHFGPMRAMIKGKADFDAAVFAENAKTVSMLAALIAAKGFPEVSETGDELTTKALPDIWLDTEGFAEVAQAFLTNSQALAETAATATDLESVKPAFMAVAKTCKGCHDDYRE